MALAFKDAYTRELWYGDRVHPDEDFICVIYSEKMYWLYNVITGKPFLPINFLNKDTALEFGKMLHHWYGEYFWIWNNAEYKTADIPQLVQYTIPDGVEILKLLEKNRHKILLDVSEFVPFYQSGA